MNYVLRRQCATIQNATRVLQHERKISVRSPALSLLADEGTRVEEAIRASQREEHQTVARLQEETHGFAPHETSADRHNIRMTEQQNTDMLGHLSAANKKAFQLECKIAIS